MELHQLNYLLAVAESQNFTRAAEKLYISQPALTQQINKLEQEIGTILFDRTHRRLTASGEILCHHARRVFSELDEARVALSEIQGLQRGTLTIGTVQTVNDYLIPQAVARFASHYPAIKISVEQLASDEVEQGVAEGHFQIGLGFVPALNPAIETELLFEENFVLVVAPSHPLAAYRVLQVMEVDGLEVVQFPNGFCTRRLWESAENIANIRTRIVIEMNTIDGIVSAVAQTQLAAILPNLALHNRPQLVGIPLQNPTPRRGVGILRRKGGYHCAASTAFAQIIRDLIPVQAGL